MPRGMITARFDARVSTAAGRSAPTLGVTSGIVLGLAVPLMVVAAIPTSANSAWLGGWLITALAGSRFAWLLASRKRRIFEMTTWLFVYVFLGLAPTVQLRAGVDPLTTPWLNHDLDWATVVLVIVGSISIMAGSVIGKRSTVELSNQSPRLVSRAKVQLLGVAALGLALYYVSQVGIGSLFGDRTSFSELRSGVFAGFGTTLPVATIVTMSLLVSLLAQLQGRRERTVLGEKRPFVMLCLTFIALFTCVNPISSPRYIFGTVILATLAGLGIYGKLSRFRLVAIGGIGGLVFLFPILDAFRRTLDSTIRFENPFESLVGGDFDSFAQVNNTILFVSERGITWGTQALGVPLFWVPRELWPSKPVDTGILLAQFRGYGFENLSAPLWAELFINGGWAALIVGMILFGIAIRRADDYTEAVLLRTSVPPILGCIIPFYLLIMLRGSLLQSMVNFAVMLLIWWLITTRNPSKARRSGTMSASSSNKTRVVPAATPARNDAT